MSTKIPHLKEKGYSKALQYSIKPIIDEIKQLKGSLEWASERLLNAPRHTIELANVSLELKKIGTEIVDKEKQLNVAVRTLQYAVDDNEEISDFVNNWVNLETKFIYAPLFGDKDFN